LSSYRYVDWPASPVSEAGIPIGPWNFIEVPALTVTASGHVLVLHRGTHPILEFEAGGTFVRGWGDGLFSEGKAGMIPPALRIPGRSIYSAVYGPAGCESCGAHAIRVDPAGNVWTVDAAGHAVYKLAPDGKVVMRLGTKGVSGTGPDKFYLPTDVAF